MIGAVPDPVRWKGLKSSDRSEMKIQSGNNDGKKMRHGFSEVKNSKSSTATYLKDKKKKQWLDHDEEELCNVDWRTKNSNVPATLCEKEWKMEKLNKYISKKKMMADDNNKTKMQIRDDKKGKNKEKLMKTHRENMQAANRKERKIPCESTSFFGEAKKGNRLNKTKIEELHSDPDEEEENRDYDCKVKNGKVSATFSELEKKKKRPNNNNSKEPALIRPAVREKRMRPTESMETEMRHNKHKRINVASDISKQKKMGTSSVPNCKKRKREERLTLEKKYWSNDSDRKIHNGIVKENKVSGSVKENNRQPPFAFFKFIYDNFEEFLVIPPTVAPRLKNLTNQHVYLKDSEGRHSQVMLSVVGNHLAFHQGWNIFVSNHLIKHGEVLLFEYVTTKRFSVRIFGSDSCERLYFNADNKSKGFRKKQTWSNMSPDDLVFFGGNSEKIYDNHYVSGEYPSSKVPETRNVSVNTKEDPKIVEREAGSGSGMQSRNGKLIAPQCKTKGTSPGNKEKTVILILDSESSANENGDTVKLTASEADSDTQHVAVNTNEDPKRSHSGIGNGSSVVLDDKKGNVPPVCSEEKQRSEKIVTDAHETDDKVGHELKLHDSDEDLGRKLEMNSIPLDSVAAVVKCHNYSKMNTGQNFGTGGSRCLEKWNKCIVNSRAALDVTRMIKPKNLQETDSIFVDGYGSTELHPVDEYFCSEGNHQCVQRVFTIPIKEPSSAERVNENGHDGTDIDHTMNEKGGGTSVHLETKGEQLERLGNIVNSQRNSNPLCLNPIVPVKCGVLGLNPPGSEGTCAFVESRFTVPTEKSTSPDVISKCRSTRIEIDHTVNGKGTAAQTETKLDIVEQVGSGVRSQISNIVVHASHAVAHESKYCFSKQEGIKSINCPALESLLPIKDKTLELDDHSPLKLYLQLCTPDTTRKWLELPKSLPRAIRQKKHDRNIVMLKDPMKRLWPVLYHEKPVFVGFTAGWNYFVAANNLQAGDVCELIKEPDEDEPVYSVKIRQQGP